MTDTEADVRAVLAQHFPEADPASLDRDALLLWSAAKHPTGGFEAYKNTEVEGLRHLARKLSSQLKALHPDLRAEVAMGVPAGENLRPIIDPSGAFSERDLKAIRAAIPLIAQHLPELLGSGLESAGKEANSKGDLGKTNWRAVGVFDECRNVWFRQMKQKAPKSLNEATIWGRFVQDVFGALYQEKTPNPRAAADAWARVQS